MNQEALALCKELNEVFNKHLKLQKLDYGQVLSIIAAFYAECVKDRELGAETEEEVSEIRNAAVDVIGELLYSDRLLDENGTTH